MDKEPLLQIPAEITKITTMRNDAIRLQVDTQEDITPVAHAMIFGFKGKPGVFAFAKSNIAESELILPEYTPRPEETKTPAQRLRGTLFRVWEQRGKKDRFNKECDSETFYNQEMERVIESYKKLLE